MLSAGNYQAKIQDWGVKHHVEKNEYKLFVKFEIVDGADKGQYITWNGSLDDTVQIGRNGKEYSRLDITRKNLKDLGYKYGEDLEAIIREPNPFDMEEVFQLDLASFDANGKAITYVRGFESTIRPKESSGSGPRKVEAKEASDVLSGLMKRNGLKSGTSPSPVQKKAVNDDLSDIPF